MEMRSHAGGDRGVTPEGQNPEALKREVSLLQRSVALLRELKRRFVPVTVMDFPNLPTTLPDLIETRGRFRKQALQLVLEISSIIPAARSFSTESKARLLESLSRFSLWERSRGLGVSGLEAFVTDLNDKIRQTPTDSSDNDSSVLESK